MRIVMTLLFYLFSLTVFSQNSSDNWNVYLNGDIVPLKLWNNDGYIEHKANPDSDYLTLIKFKGHPTKGKIHFFSGDDYPLPLTRYKLGVPTIIKLQDIVKWYKEEARHKIKVQIVEISERTIRPIVIVNFNTDNK